MKRSFLPVCFFLAAMNAGAQKADWDSTYRPGSYELKVSQFRSYPNSDKDIIFLGNSITDYTDWNELLQLKEARNRGISGDITFGVLERLDEVIEGKPSKVFILIGINDIARNIPDSVITGNYKKMILRIKEGSPKTKIYFNTLFPVNNSFTAKNHFNKDEHIAFVNNAIRSFVQSDKITVIDMHPQLLDTEKKLDKKYTYDGLHLNNEGYLKWAEILKPYIN